MDEDSYSSKNRIVSFEALIDSVKLVAVAKSEFEFQKMSQHVHVLEVSDYQKGKVIDKINDLLIAGKSSTGC